MWENINELLPTGRGAAPIISSWENTAGRTEKQKEGDEKDPVLFPLIHHSEALCHSSLLGSSSGGSLAFMTDGWR